MSFLPIVERELRVRARLKSTHWLRAGGAFLAMIAVGIMLLTAASESVAPSRVGSVMFQVLAWPAFIYCLLEGVRATADCLSEEKRGGTLGLLFLTDLKGYDVVLGKLIATSLNSFYVLLAILPLVALPLLLGGVMAGEFWRLALVLVNTLFLSLTVGICVSSISRQEQRAWSGTLGIMALLTFYPLLWDEFHWLPKLPALFSPSMGFMTLDDAIYRTKPGDFWWSVLCTNALSWGFLVLASYLLPRTWQDKTVEPGANKKTGVRSSERARQRRLELLAANPVLWMASRRLKGDIYLWLLVGIVILLAASAATIISNRVSGSAAWYIILAALGLHLLLPLWVAALASYSFAESRTSGALELLLSTPVSAAKIIQGHSDSLKRMFFTPVLVMALMECCVFFSALASLRNVSQDILGTLFMIAVPVLFITDLYAVGWYGLWMSLSSQKPSHALTKTSLFIIVLPYLFCGVPCNFLYPIIGILKNWIFIAYAKGQLNRRFHEAVTQQFTGQGTLVPAPLPPPLPPKLG